MTKNDDDIREIQEWSQNQQFLPRDLSESFTGEMVQGIGEGPPRAPPDSPPFWAFLSGKAFINTFIVGCGGDIEKAKKVLSNYFYARQSIPEIFTGRDPLLKENILAWKSSCFVPLPTKEKGCRVFLGASLSSENYSFVAFVKQSFMCYDLLIKNNEWGNGNRILVLSYDKITYENLSTYTIYITRKTAECERENYLPGKLVAIHNVHIPPFMKKIHERFKPYLLEDDEKRVIFHKNLKSLHKYINRDILPIEFGGRAGPIKNLIDKWYDILKAHRHFFVQEEEKRMKEARVKVGEYQVATEESAPELQQTHNSSIVTGRRKTLG